MKKAIAFLVMVCLLVTAAAASLGEDARFVTVQEWLQAEGDCGDCMLLLRIRTVLNPVFAIAEDETGTVNIFSGSGEDSAIAWFMGEDCVGEGFTIVIANPRYNIFDGSVEMADWTLLRVLPDLAPEE